MSLSPTSHTFFHVPVLQIDGCVLGGMPRSSLSGPRAQEANTGDSKQTFINKSKLKKTSPAKIYRGLPGWAENT